MAAIKTHWKTLWFSDLFIFTFVKDHVIITEVKRDAAFSVN